MFFLWFINWFLVGVDLICFGIILYSDILKLIIRFFDVLYYNLIGLKLKFLGLEFLDGEMRIDKVLKMVGIELYVVG